MKKIRQKIVPVLGGALDITVNIAGKGKPLVFLHSAGGFYWDDFLDSMADHYKVYAPYFPGTAPGKPDELEHLDTMWDAVLAYDDMLDALKLKKIRLMGHSFGGLLATELAAQRPKSIEKLVLIAPIGLWLKDAPYTVANWTALDFEGIMDVLFYDRNAPRVQRRMAAPEDVDEATLWNRDFIWTIACTAKLIWPIPDKGLKKRIHRVTAPSLVVWGENDKLISPAYAEAFGKALPEADVFMIPQCGHEPPLEQCEMLQERVGLFLAA